MRGVWYPDPSPPWLREARRQYREPTLLLYDLIGRICETDSGMEFHYRVRRGGRQDTVATTGRRSPTGC